MAEPIDPEMWETPRMRAALAKRDIATVYRLLRTGGVSQRRISKLTGQAQSEICEITSGRKVTRYDLLVRIADGFGVPRGYLGTAYDEADQHEDDAEEVDEDVKRGQARDAISRSYDEYGDADPKTDGGLWYPLGDLTSAEAATRHALGEHDRAVECAESAVETREDRRVRSHAFRYSRLAMFNLAAGDRDTGVQAGREAVRCAGLVRSERVRARIKPVADWAAKYGRDEDARNLARDVRKLIRT